MFDISIFVALSFYSFEISMDYFPFSSLWNPLIKIRPNFPFLFRKLVHHSNFCNLLGWGQPISFVRVEISRDPYKPWSHHFEDAYLSETFSLKIGQIFYRRWFPFCSENQFIMLIFASCGGGATYNLFCVEISRDSSKFWSDNLEDAYL